MTTIESPPLMTTHLPPPGTYALNPDRCLVEFATKHFLVASVRGSFAPLGGELVVARQPLDSWVRVDVDAASFSTGTEERDRTVTNDVLAVAEYPVIRFESVAVSESGPGRFSVIGDLYIRDIVSEIALDARLVTVAGDRVVFSAAGTISRSVFELDFGALLEKAGVVVSDRIALTLGAEFVG